MANLPPRVRAKRKIYWMVQPYLAQIPKSMCQNRLCLSQLNMLTIPSSLLSVVNKGTARCLSVHHANAHDGLQNPGANPLYMICSILGVSQTQLSSSFDLVFFIILEARPYLRLLLVYSCMLPHLSLSLFLSICLYTHTHIYIYMNEGPLCIIYSVLIFNCFWY